MIVGSAPVLLVADVVAAANYYRDRVGFSYERFWGDPPGFCILQRGSFHLMLKQANDPAEVRPNWKVVEGIWDVYFWVDDVEALYRELIDRGATIDYEMCDQPYGCREFGIQDLDGHDIAFGQDMA
jgi:uncharacterized glyoxalase superfamily protein PhnB